MWSRRLGARLATGCLVAALGATRPARAHPLSDYEKESVRIGLAEVGGEVDPDPEHKTIEGVEVVTLKVFEKRDPLPNFLLPPVNWFHITTRADVVERELLLKTGDAFDPALADESERNLRVRQLSAVLVVPLKGSSPDRVRLLVVTKDVWSLRVNWEPVFVNGSLQTLVLQPAEENFLGRHKTLLANVILERATYTLGLGYVDPRIGGSRLQSSASANLVFNCRTGDIEGSNGSFTYGKPLYSTQTKWAWATAVGWNDGIVRPAGTIGQSICSGDVPTPVHFRGTPAGDIVPYDYHQDVIRGEFSAVRSFGAVLKNDISFGLEATRAAYEPPDLSPYPVVVQNDFQKLLPVSDTRLSPFVQLHAYRNRFLRVLDFETLGLQEDYQLGHELFLRAYPAAKALGSTRNLFGMYGGLSYTVAVSDGLARAYAASSVQLSNSRQSDGYVLAGARLVSPRSPIGRLLFDGQILDRFYNYLNPIQSLGGTTRLRGYRPQAFTGPDLLVSNVEFRSRPLEILSVQIGAVGFYDVGDAFATFATMKLRQGVGGGLRFVFPQIQRSVFRVDVGVPLDPHDPAAETTVIAQFEQAFVMPELGAPGYVDYGPASLQ